MKQATNLSIVFKNALNTETKSPAVETITQPTEALVSTAVIRNDPVVEHENPIQVQKNHSNDVNELAPMNLQWDKSYWEVQITAAASTVDIWGRNLESGDWVCHLCV